MASTAASMASSSSGRGSGDTRADRRPSGSASPAVGRGASQGASAHHRDGSSSRARAANGESSSSRSHTSAGSSRSDVTSRLESAKQTLNDLNKSYANLLPKLVPPAMKHDNRSLALEQWKQQQALEGYGPPPPEELKRKEAEITKLRESEDKIVDEVRRLRIRLETARYGLFYDYMDQNFPAFLQKHMPAPPTPLTPSPNAPSKADLDALRTEFSAKFDAQKKENDALKKELEAHKKETTELLKAHQRRHEMTLEDIRKNCEVDMNQFKKEQQEEMVGFQKELVFGLEDMGNNVRNNWSEKVEAFVRDKHAAVGEELYSKLEESMNAMLEARGSGRISGLANGSTNIPQAKLDLFDDKGKLTPEAQNEVLQGLKTRFEGSSLARSMFTRILREDPHIFDQVVQSPDVFNTLRRVFLASDPSLADEPVAKRRRTESGEGGMVNGVHGSYASKIEFDHLVAELRRGQIYDSSALQAELEDALTPAAKTAGREAARSEAKKVKDSFDESVENLRADVDRVDEGLAKVKGLPQRLQTITTKQSEMSTQMEEIVEKLQNPAPPLKREGISPEQLENAVQTLIADINSRFLPKDELERLYAPLDDFEALNDTVRADLDDTGEHSHFRSRVLCALGLSSLGAAEGDEAARKELFDRMAWYITQDDVPVARAFGTYVLRLILRAHLHKPEPGHNRDSQSMDVDGSERPSTRPTGGHEAEDALIKDLSSAISKRVQHDLEDLENRFMGQIAELDTTLKSALAMIGESGSENQGAGSPNVEAV